MLAKYALLSERQGNIVDDRHLLWKGCIQAEGSGVALLNRTLMYSEKDKDWAQLVHHMYEMDFFRDVMINTSFVSTAGKQYGKL